MLRFVIVGGLTGIPCKHAISCLRHERISAESVLHPCYSVESFNRAYGNNIWPCKDMSTWEKVNGPPILPPIYEKKVGRPPKSRRKQPYEIQGENGPKMSKHGVIITCSYCKGEHHNAGGYMLKKMGLRPDEHEPQMVATEAVVNQEQSHPKADPATSQWFSQGAPSSSQLFSQEGSTSSLLYPQLTSTMLMHMMDHVK